MARRVIGRKRTPAKKKTTRRRVNRRISGISGGVGGAAMKVVGLGVGAIAARELNTVAVKMLPSLSPMMSGILQVGAGYILPMLVKGNKFVGDMGDGMMANGVMVVAVSTGVISGTNSPNSVSYRIGAMNGGNIRTIAGFNGGNIRTIAGTSMARPQRVVKKSVSGCY
jgi:hypothetical protein